MGKKPVNKTEGERPSGEKPGFIYPEILEHQKKQWIKKFGKDKSPPFIPNYRLPDSVDDSASKPKEKLKNLNPTWWDSFAVEYMTNGENGAAAYRAARPGVSKKTATCEAWKLLRNPDFSRLLDGYRECARKETGMDLKRFLDDLIEIATFDLRSFLEASPSGAITLVSDWKERSHGSVIESIEMDSDVRKEHSEDVGQVQNIKVKIRKAPKLKAYEILGKALGFLKDSVELNQKQPVEIEVVGLPPLNKK